MGGMSRNDVRRAMGRVFRVRSWKLLLILIPVAFLVATLLRLDHIQMAKLRNEVLMADESRDEERLKEALVGLKDFVSHHMVVNFVEKNGETNLYFGTGPFYLEHAYEEDAREALAKAEQALGGDSNPNGNIFKKAADYCDPLAKRYGWGHGKLYFDCIMGELAKYPSMGEIEDGGVALVPPVGEYRIDLASPVWYPSFAGLVLAVAVVMGVVIIIRFLIWGVLRITLIMMKKG